MVFHNREIWRDRIAIIPQQHHLQAVHYQQDRVACQFHDRVSFA